VAHGSASERENLNHENGDLHRHGFINKIEGSVPEWR